MTEPNIMEIYSEAMDAARGNFREMMRDMKAKLVTQPLGGKRMSPDERRQNYFALSRDPALLQSQYDFLQQRFGLPNPDRPDHIIPRRLWDGLKKGKQEFEKEAE